MFKVICINGDFEGKGCLKVQPKEGETYTVVAVNVDKDKTVWYELAEFFKETKKYIYCDEYESIAFLPLSDLDELQLVNEKQLVNQ